MRLKENFFETDALLLLEAMPDGYLYSNILLKMYLKSLKGEGRLMYNNYIPYDEQMLATITHHQIGTVKEALEKFRLLGLIEVLENGAIYMLNIQEYIGQSSSEADRKRLYDRQIAEEKRKIVGNVGEISEKSTPEIELKKELDIEKEIELEKDVESKCKKTSSRFTPPTLEEVKSYCIERNNNVEPNRFVDFYSCKGWMVGKNKMKDWKAAIRTWEKRDSGVRTKDGCNTRNNATCPSERTKECGDDFTRSCRARGIDPSSVKFEDDELPF